MSLTKKITKSASLILFVRAFQRSIGMISLLVLARLLEPKDFGVVAIATMLVFLFDTVSEGGTQHYIIQKKNLDDDDIKTAWTISILSKLAIFLMLVLIAPLLANFVNLPESTSAIRALAFVLPISAFASPRLLMLRRELEYHLISKILMIERLISFSVTVSLAYFLQNYWAMIFGVIVSYVSKTLLSHYYAPYPMSFSLAKIREQMSFSLWMVWRSIVGYIRAEFDIVFVSKIYGAEQLGGFSLMRNLSYLPGREIIMPISNVFLASFSEIRRRGDSIGDRVVVALTIVLFCVMPIIGYLHLFHQELVTIFLGDKWIEYSNFLPLLSLFTITFAISTFVQQGLIASGDIRILSVYETVTILSLLLLFLTIFSGTIERFIVFRLLFAFAVLIFLLVICSIRFRLPVLSLTLAISLMAISSYAAVLVTSLILLRGEESVVILSNMVYGTLIYFLAYLLASLFFLSLFKKEKTIESVRSLALKFLRRKLES